MSIKDGKVYGSKPAAYQVLVRSERKVWSQDGAILLDTIPPLTAEFAYHGGEYTFQNPLTGSPDVAADIRGHFFDSAQQALEKGWSQEEHDMVVKVLDQQCVKTPEYVWEVTLEQAAVPWPTYDDTHHKQIPVLAEQLGLVAEALAYEQQNKNRDEIVAKLTEILAAAEPEPSDDLLTAA